MVESKLVAIFAENSDGTFHILLIAINCVIDRAGGAAYGLQRENSRVLELYDALMQKTPGNRLDLGDISGQPNYQIDEVAELGAASPSFFGRWDHSVTVR